MILGPADEERFVAWCDASPDDTVWLRIAWSEGGARFAVEERDGRIEALAAHDRKGLLHVNADWRIAELAREALHPDLPIVGLCGSPERVEAARAALGLEDRPVKLLSREVIMSVEVDRLIVPAILARDDVVVRRARREDLALLLDWHERYFREVHKMTMTAELVRELLDHLRHGRVWVLEDQGAIGNTACFSAVFPGLVQIEYSYSPPELRAKKYARAVVAGSLLQSRAEGIRRAVFNTAETNLAVRSSVEPIGFRVTGRYWAMQFAEPVSPAPPAPP